MKNINKQEILEAIKEGVKDAFLTAMEAGDGYNGVIIKEEILKAIKDGTYSALHDEKI